MQKAFSINLAGIVYSINEDAYHKLEIYFKNIKQYFSTNPDKNEIIDDIEHSIAEKFTERLSTTRQVVTLQDVEHVISEMGETKDFTENEQNSTSTLKTSAKSRKLFRDTDNQIIAGVCSGIAAYFGIETVWVRIIAAVLLFTPLTGFIILSYLVLWISMPEAKNIVDKMQMQGEPVSLTSIESAVKNKLGDNSPEESVMVKILLLPFRIIGAFFTYFKKIAPFLMKVVGLFLLLSSIIVTTVLTTSAIAATFFSHIITMPLRNFPTNITEYSIVWLLYLSVMIPLLFLILIAVSLIKKKNLFTATSIIAIFTAWMISISIMGLIISTYYPTLQTKYNTTYKSKKEFPVAPFSNIEMSGAYEIEVIQGNEYKVIAEGGQREVNILNVYVKDNTLRVEEHIILPQCFLFCSRDKRLYITVPSLEKINVSGSTDVQLGRFNNPGDIQILLSGTSEVYTTEFIANSIDAKLSGSSELLLQGSAKQLIATLSGVSSLEAVDLPVATGEFKLSGSSNAEVNVTDSLKADVSGTSNLSYKNVPRILDKNISGSASIESLDIEDLDLEESSN